MRIIVTLLLSIISAAAMAGEVVYVDDLVNLGIRAEPRSGEPPLKVVTTGMRLEVLATDNNYLRVRSEEGIEGWVNKFYTTETLPARARIEAVEASNLALTTQLAESAATIADLRQAATLLEEQLTQLGVKNEALHNSLEAYQTTDAMAEYRWMFKSGGLIALFLLGVFLGIQWYKKRIGRRIGGLEF